MNQAQRHHRQSTYRGHGSERLFHAGPVVRVDNGAHGSMAIGPWNFGPDGLPSAGSLGVLIDDVVGFPLLGLQPAGRWPVTTEISVDMCGLLPAVGSRLYGTSEVINADTADAPQT